MGLDEALDDIDFGRHHGEARLRVGLGPAHLPEFHLIIEVEDLAQLDRAFGHVASRANPVESFHHAVNAKVTDAFFALYRDFPDPVRTRGQERF